MNISIIIPTFNRPEILQESLNALVNSFEGLAVIEIIIINDSTDELCIQIPRGQLISIHQNQGKGPGNARNLGLKIASFENIILLDDDIQFTKESSKVAVSSLATIDDSSFVNIAWIYPEKLISSMKNTVLGRFLLSGNLYRIEGWMNYDDIFKTELISVDAIASYCLITKKSNLHQIGNYNSSINIPGLEDADLSNRIQQANGKMILDCTTRVLHNESDRINIKGRLSRKYREGKSRRIGANNSFAQFNTTYSLPKQLLFKVVYHSSPILIRLINRINIPYLDIITFRLIRILDGAHIFAGYNSKTGLLPANS